MAEVIGALHFAADGTCENIQLHNESMQKHAKSFSASSIDEDDFCKLIDGETAKAIATNAKILKDGGEKIKTAALGCNDTIRGAAVKAWSDGTKEINKSQGTYIGVVVAAVKSLLNYLGRVAANILERTLGVVDGACTSFINGITYCFGALYEIFDV